jgi:hypothetical protein
MYQKILSDTLRCLLRRWVCRLVCLRWESWEANCPSFYLRVIYSAESWYNVYEIARPCWSQVRLMVSRRAHDPEVVVRFHNLAGRHCPQSPLGVLQTDGEDITLREAVS